MRVGKLRQALQQVANDEFCKGWQVKTHVGEENGQKFVLVHVPFSRVCMNPFKGFARASATGWQVSEALPTILHRFRNALINGIVDDDLGTVMLCEMSKQQ